MDSQSDPEREPYQPDPPCDYLTFHRMVSYSPSLNSDVVRWHDECNLSKAAFERIARDEGFHHVEWADQWVR